MEERKRVSLSELRVGIFVLLGAGILALAIFQIGSTVGLFQETFYARTYLNNVSGLKPGDIVLLGGVEIGNVTEVEITTPDRIPDTEENLRTKNQIIDLQDQYSILTENLIKVTQRTNALHLRHQSESQKWGSSSKQANRLRTELENLNNLRKQSTEKLDKVKRSLQSVREDLQNIVVRMEIQARYRDWIRQDSYISLGSVGLLGDKYIQISLGRSVDPPKSVVEPIMDNWWGKEKVEFIEITGKPQTDFAELITGANDILVNFRTLSEKIQDVTNRFESGEGTVGKFLSDPSFYNTLTETVVSASVTMKNASQIIQEISKGQGTLSKLIHEQDLYQKLSDSMINLDKILDNLETGKGTIGKLFKDPKLYNSARDTMASIKSMAARLESGQGTLGKLSTDDTLYLEINNTMRKLTGFVNDIEKGRGTLGQLAKDDQLYKNLNQLSAEMVKLIYDFRQNPKRFLTIKFKIF